jgi:hypothetical protein
MCPQRTDKRTHHTEFFSWSAVKSFKQPGFGILEHIVIGVCETCGNRYYTADLLHTVHDIATGKRQPACTEVIPVADRSEAI